MEAFSGSVLQKRPSAQASPPNEGFENLPSDCGAALPGSTDNISCFSVSTKKSLPSLLKRPEEFLNGSKKALCPPGALGSMNLPRPKAAARPAASIAHLSLDAPPAGAGFGAGFAVEIDAVAAGTGSAFLTAAAWGRGAAGASILNNCSKGAMGGGSGSLLA